VGEGADVLERDRDSVTASSQVSVVYENDGPVAELTTGLTIT